MKLSENVNRQSMENVYVVTNNKKLLNIKTLLESNLPENNLFFKNIEIGNLVLLDESSNWKKYSISGEVKNNLTDDRDIIELINNLIEFESGNKYKYGLELWAVDFNSFIGAFTHREFVV